MALTRRQELCYNHRVDLYAPQYTIAADGKRGPITYTLAYEDVPCRLEIKGSPNSGSPVGRIEMDVVISVDVAHFSEDQEIDDGWWMLNKTLLPDGSQSIQYGRWHVVRGEPRRIINSLRRRGGKKSVMCSQESRPPLGLPL